MRHRALFFAAALFLNCRPAGEAVDFQLQELTVTAGEGGSTDFFFPHEDNRVFYRPPAGWRVEQSAARFTARPPAPMSGVFTLETVAPLSKLPPPGTNTPEALDQYGKAVLAGFNSQAQQPVVVECVTESLGGRALPCTRVTIEYTDQVLARRCTVCYVQFRLDLTLLVRIDSLKQDAVVHKTALHSLEGFTEMPGK